jgi:cytochrome c5
VVASADAPAAGGAAKSADEIVGTSCAACHGTGVMGAPKIGDNGAWAPRIAQGYDTLVKNAVNGIRAMPAKGGNTALSDAEVASAVALMANKSGASFK